MAGRGEPDRPQTPPSETLHASCVAIAGRAVLILGASGRGKSGLALHLMALGASLVADDRVQIWREGDTLMADAPDRLRGLIEAREVGILRVDAAGPHAIVLCIDMDAIETARLPQPQEIMLLDRPITVLKKSKLAHFPAAIIAYLRGQREA